MTLLTMGALWYQDQVPGANMRLALITGTTRGLGLALADAMTARGAFVVGIARGANNAHERRANTFALEEDLVQIDQWLGTSFELSKVIELSKLDELLFFNNAATIEPLNYVGKLPQVEAWRAVMLNYYAPLRLVDYVMRLQKGFGFRLHLINISSGAATRPISGWSLYCSSKAACRSFFDVTAAENRDNPLISVSNIDPGVIDTNMQDTLRNTTPDQFPDAESFRRLKLMGKLQAPDVAAQKLLEALTIS